jgi:hypothetical protein
MDFMPLLAIPVFYYHITIDISNMKERETYEVGAIIVFLMYGLDNYV